MRSVRQSLRKARHILENRVTVGEAVALTESITLTPRLDPISQWPEACEEYGSFDPA